MLDEAVQRIENKIQRKHLLGHAEKDERSRVAKKLEGFLQGVEAADIHPVELLRRMVHGVQAPEPHAPFMAGTVQPVAEKISGEDHESCLHQGRKSIRPEAVEMDSPGMEEAEQGQCQQESQRPG